MDLKDKVVIVTGGGQGLGEAICKALAPSGAKIALCDIKQEQAEVAALSLQNESCQATAYTLDVSNEKTVADTVRAIYEDYGHIDALINNAGVDVTKSLEDLSIEEWDRVMNVNLRGPFLMSKAVLPCFTEKGGGHIVNIASTAAKRTWTEASAYHASKWGLLGFSHAIHAEGRKQNVKVTAVIAGGMRTPFIMERFPETDPAVLQNPKNVAETVRFVLTQPVESVIPEVMVIPMRETSWP